MFKSVAVSKLLQGKTMLYTTTNGGKIWACQPGGAQSIDKKYLPAACR